MKQKWSNGDVIRVALPGEFRYLQLVGKDSKKIEVLRILDLTTRDPVADASSLDRSRTLYWIQSFCSVLVDDSRFTYIGNASGSGDLPTLRRRFVKGWILVKGDVEQFVPNPISDEVAHLSLEEGLPPQVIVDRLVAGWRPEQDRGDFADLMRAHRDARQRASAIEQKRETIFYLDFPSHQLAAEAEDLLRQRGFSARQEHDERSLAVSHCWRAGDSLDSMDMIELKLLEIAGPFSGTISGRETSV